MTRPLRLEHAPIPVGRVGPADFVTFSEYISRALSEIVDRGQNYTQIVSSVALTTGSTTSVAHGLGRKWSGWRVVDKTANAVVWRDATSSADSAVFLPLTCSANVTIDLEVW